MATETLEARLEHMHVHDDNDNSGTKHYSKVKVRCAAPPSELVINLQAIVEESSSH